MKLALILTVIEPAVGGVIIMGHRGTAKSTAVRALADLLPPVIKVKGCVYGCDPARPDEFCGECAARARAGQRLTRERGAVPVVDLPLGATEDRVCGTLDIERALTHGVKSFEPGLLAKANRGFLYIDEVNLLEDHLVDLLLDAASSGRNIVEREGISISHPARFVLVGSGNPEEGELRPQLLDRFGLYVHVETISDLTMRVEIVERCERFERDPVAFRVEAGPEQEKIRNNLIRARKLLPRVKMERSVLLRVAELCVSLGIDGHRGELTIARSARAFAAFEGRTRVGLSDIRRVAMMALRHRLRRDPLDQIDSGTRITEALDNFFPPEGSGQFAAGGNEPDNSENTGRGARSRQKSQSDRRPEPESIKDLILRAVDSPLPADLSASPKTRSARSAAKRVTGGKDSKPGRARHGRYVRSLTSPDINNRVALDATIRTAAQQRHLRQAGDRKTLPIKRHDLRFKQLKRKSGTLFIFAVDASGSMALGRMRQAKGALIRLLQRAYVRRDAVALITFRGDSARVLIEPTKSVEVARRPVEEIPSGGGTPVAAGLLGAIQLARRARKRNACRIAVLLFTDGRANVGLDPSARGEAINSELRRIGSAMHHEKIECVLIDTRPRFASDGEGVRLADCIGARYLYLPRAGSAGIRTAIDNLFSRPADQAPL